MNQADKIRQYAKERYVVAAHSRGERRFSIPVREPVHALGMGRNVPNVCNALKTGKFLKDNNLRLVETISPKSGQSTTVVYTYEFVDTKTSPKDGEDTWGRLRGVLKDVFVELGGGEAYLSGQRDNFYAPKEGR